AALSGRLVHGQKDPRSTPRGHSSPVEVRNLFKDAVFCPGGRRELAMLFRGLCAKSVQMTVTGLGLAAMLLEHRGPFSYAKMLPKGNDRQLSTSTETTAAPMSRNVTEDGSPFVVEEVFTVFTSLVCNKGPASSSFRQDQCYILSERRRWLCRGMKCFTCSERPPGQIEIHFDSLEKRYCSSEFTRDRMQRGAQEFSSKREQDILVLERSGGTDLRQPGYCLEVEGLGFLAATLCARSCTILPKRFMVLGCLPGASLICTLGGVVALCHRAFVDERDVEVLKRSIVRNMMAIIGKKNGRGLRVPGNMQFPSQKLSSGEDVASGSVLLVCDEELGDSLFDRCVALPVPGSTREAEALRILRSLIQATVDLDSLGLAPPGCRHGRIRAENTWLQHLPNGDCKAFVLVFRVVKVLLSDFGESRSLEDQGSDAMFVAPELVEGQSTTPTHDLFSCGVLGYALAMGRPGKCKTFSFAKSHGLQLGSDGGQSFLGDRRCPASKEGRMSSEYKEILGCLLELDPGIREQKALSMRATLPQLGEDKHQYWQTPVKFRLANGKIATLARGIFRGGGYFTVRSVRYWVFAAGIAPSETPLAFATRAIISHADAHSAATGQSIAGGLSFLDAVRWK
ncbi:Pskh1, partial [Symbiodinium sp. KB8]